MKISTKGRYALRLMMDIAIYGEKEAEEIPATIIHLDQPIVDLLDKDDMFILVVNKSYVFIIPKSAFTEDKVQKIREKLSVIMGIRYKIWKVKSGKWNCVWGFNIIVPHRTKTNRKRFVSKFYPCG